MIRKIGNTLDKNSFSFVTGVPTALSTEDFYEDQNKACDDNDGYDDYEDGDDCNDVCDDYNDLIGVLSSWAIQIYKLVTQEYKNSILDIIDRPQLWKTTIIFCKCYVHVLYSLCFCLSRKVIIASI